MGKAWNFGLVLPWLTWVGVAIACTVGYLLFLTQVLNYSGAWIGGPTLIVTPVLVLGFAVFVWLPAYWALAKWYRRLNWAQAIVVSGALGSVVTTLLGVGLFSSNVGSPLYGWFLLGAFMAGASSHAHLIDTRKNQA